MPISIDNRVASAIPVVEQTEKLTSVTKLRRRSLVREFALNTSTHGLPGIARSQSKHNCIFWTLSFLIFTGIMIYFVVQSIKNYFEYPTQTSVTVIIERSQIFPAVSLCNYAPARHDRFIQPFVDYLMARNITNTNDTSIFPAEYSLYIRDFFQYELNLNKPVLKYFFTLDIMLIACSYNDIPCTANDFTPFLSSSHGLCYTFNAKRKNNTITDLRYTNDYGGSGKLQLRIYAHNHLYIPYVSQDVSAAIVTMVHDNTQLPLIDIAGIELAPGRKHKIGYKKKTTYFLSSPYTECTTKIPLAMQEMFDRYEGTDYAYSQGVCYTLCTQAYIYQQCGCVSPLEWSARSIVLPGTNKIIQALLCNFTDICYINATLQMASTTSISNEFCSDCSQSCSNGDFSVTTSAAAAPSIEYAYIVKAFVESLSVPLPTDWQTNWFNDIQNNYIGLDIVCESSLIENYTQEASIGAVEVLSNVGGHTGLWIGISFLSIMEFVEMLYRLFRHELNRAQHALFA